MSRSWPWAQKARNANKANRIGSDLLNRTGSHCKSIVGQLGTVSPHTASNSTSAEEEDEFMKFASLSLSLACALLLPAHASAEYRISGPYTHENLSIFLIHGDGGGRNYLTLKDAVAQKKVVVSETKKVNELTVENISGEPVFIQGGDIVKGGQQDRVISNDFVLPSKSGKVPVSAFCVENGRWTQRGAESPRVFASSSDIIATKNLKMSVNAKKTQTELFRQVAPTQPGFAHPPEVTLSPSPPN